jgi:hypothetical protein
MDSIKRDEIGHYRGMWKGKEINFPSVTTVLGLLADYSRVDKDVMERACQFGTAVHSIVDLFEKGTLDEASLKPQESYLADMTGILDAWKTCKKKFDINVIETEPVVVSLKCQYAGRADVIASVGKPGVPSLIEIKSRAYNAMLEPLQTAAYLEAYPTKLKRRFFCELRLDGSYQFREIKGKDDFHYFLCVLAAFNWRQNHG